MPKALVIEDEIMVALLVEEMLTSQGYSADSVTDSREGLALALHGAYDVIVLDINFGAGRPDGFELIRRIRAEGISTRIIVSTAYSYEQCVQALQEGADAYVQKPFSQVQLEACLRKMESAA